MPPADGSSTGIGEKGRGFQAILAARLPRLGIEPVTDEGLKGLLAPEDFTPTDIEAGPL